MKACPGVVYLVDGKRQERQRLGEAASAHGLEVEGYDTAGQFLDAYQRRTPACLVADTRLPRISGLDLQTALLERGDDIPVIFVASQATIPECVQAMKHGAVDFLEKPQETPTVLKRIDEALTLDGNNRECESKRALARHRYARLTPREREVFALVTAGLSNKAVARVLGISFRTVEIHRRNLTGKMRAEGLPELILMAARCGILGTEAQSATGAVRAASRGGDPAPRHGN